MEDTDSNKLPRENYETAIAIIKELKPFRIGINCSVPALYPGLEEIVQPHSSVHAQGKTIKFNPQSNLKQVIKQVVKFVQDGVMPLSLDVDPNKIEMYFTSRSPYSAPIILDIKERRIHYSGHHTLLSQTNEENLKRISCKYDFPIVDWF